MTAAKCSECGRVSKPTASGAEVIKHTASCIVGMRVPGDERVLAQLRRELIARADERHAQYPQYVDHWRGWKLGVMVERHYAHGATLAQRGDFVLVKPDGPHELPGAFPPGQKYHTIYAELYGVDCSTRAEKVRVLT